MKETQGLAFQHKTDFKLHRGMKQESKEIQQIKKYMIPGPHLRAFSLGRRCGHSTHKKINELRI